jgi:hypothetical protein
MEKEGGRGERECVQERREASGEAVCKGQQVVQ